MIMGCTFKTSIFHGRHDMCQMRDTTRAKERSSMIMSLFHEAFTDDLRGANDSPNFPRGWIISPSAEMKRPCISGTTGVRRRWPTFRLVPVCSARILAALGFGVREGDVSSGIFSNITFSISSVEAGISLHHRFVCVFVFLRRCRSLVYVCFGAHLQMGQMQASARIRRGEVVWSILLLQGFKDFRRAPTITPR